MPLQRPNIPSMPTQHLVLPRLSKTPHLDRPVVPARGEFLIRGAKTDRATGFPVSGDSSEVVDRGRKVLEGSRVVCREEEGARVGVGEGVDWVVVCLSGGSAQG